MSRTSLASLVVTSVLSLVASGCRNAPVTATVDPASAAPGVSAAKAPPASALHLGAPIETSAPTVALADLAKNPAAWAGKSFATEGTVTAVCQHMGCWMELRGDGDSPADSGQAHVKMAGHHFFVPKTAAGHKARVLATLEAANPGEPGGASCSDEGNGAKLGSCSAEAEAQLGHPLSKLELVADGVELM
jgi:hypothetical protein